MLTVVAATAGAVTVPNEEVGVYITTSTPAKLYTIGCQIGSLDMSRPGTRRRLVLLEPGRQAVVNGT